VECFREFYSKNKQDMLKMKFNPDIPGYKWVIKCAGNVPVVCAGSSKLPDQELLQRTAGMVEAGASGMAIGRNVWQHNNPLGLTRALKKIIFEGKKPDAALKMISKK